MSKALPKVEKAALELEASFESLRQKLESRAAELSTYVSRPDPGLLSQLRKNRTLIVERINAGASGQHAISEQAHGVKVEESWRNTQVLAVFVNDFKKKRSPNVKPTFRFRGSEVAKRFSKGTNSTNKWIGLDQQFNKDDVVIHVIKRTNLTKPHGRLVAMKGDGTIIREMGVYGVYGKAQHVKLKVDMKNLKDLLKDGAVATAATAQLVRRLSEAIVRASISEIAPTDRIDSRATESQIGSQRLAQEI